MKIFNNLIPIAILVAVVFLALRPDKWFEEIPEEEYIIVGATPVPTLEPEPTIVATPEIVVTYEPIVFIEKTIDYSQFGGNANTVQWLFEVGPIVLAFLFIFLVFLGMGMAVHIAYLERKLRIEEEIIRLRALEIEEAQSIPSSRAPVVVNTAKSRHNDTVKINQLDIKKSILCDFVRHAAEIGLNENIWIDRGFAAEEIDAVLSVLEDARVVVARVDDFDAVLKEGRGGSKNLARYFGLSVDDLKSDDHS